MPRRVKLALLRLVKPFGEVETVRFRSFAVDAAAKGPRLTKREALSRAKLAQHKPNMNAYVVYSSEGAARAAALALNTVNFTVTWSETPSAVQGAPAGSTVRNSSNTTRRTGRAAASSATSATPSNTQQHLEAWRILRTDLASGASFVAHLSIFVGGLPFKEADEEVVRAHFSPFGAIDNVRIVRDRSTGVGKGFGYVQFRNASGVDRAVAAARAAEGASAC